MPSTVSIRFRIRHGFLSKGSVQFQSSCNALHVCRRVQVCHQATIVLQVSPFVLAFITYVGFDANKACLTARWSRNCRLCILLDKGTFSKISHWRRSSAKGNINLSQVQSSNSQTASSRRSTFGVPQLSWLQACPILPLHLFLNQ